MKKRDFSPLRTMSSIGSRLLKFCLLPLVQAYIEAKHLPNFIMLSWQKLHHSTRQKEKYYQIQEIWIAS